ncbi:MAG: type VI secretion system ATPase TssH [Gammaproteobacteria bacterium]|nr:type VI secretion system ATPase TssH [Gammaproteobacteria bacterium]
MINVNLKSLIDKLNDFTRNALEGAAGICLSRGQYNVEIEHWLLKILEQGGSDLLAILDKYEVDAGKVIAGLNKTIDRFKTGNTRPPSLSPAVVDLAKNAWVLCSVEYDHPQTTSAHLLTAIMLDDVFRRQALDVSIEFKKIPPESLRELTAGIVGTTKESATLRQGSPTSSGESAKAPRPSKTPSLDKYTINLTDRAQRGEIDPVLGRDQEVRQIIDILTRRRQNNPILTGEAGVGKTAVVEGFALRIAAHDVPEPLKNVAVHTLDLGLLQAGASVKGEFENRLKSVISEVKASTQPIIMFIDEAHTMIGAGGKEGQGDAANLLKPALARGELRTIAATTWAEYKKYFERDPALTRRFQVVKIEEPDTAKAIDMMRGIAKSLEQHHKVHILDDAIISSVTLSQRYIPGRQLPDKSVSLLDTACARVALSQSTTPALIEDCQRRIRQYETTIAMLEKEHALGGDCEQRLQELRQAREKTEHELGGYSAQWDTEKNITRRILSIRKQLEDDFLLNRSGNAAESGTNKKTPQPLGATERSELKQQVIRLYEELRQTQGESPLMAADVDSQAVAEVVANWTGIPVGRMQSDQIQSVLSLDQRLGERVIGQQHALESIAQSIRISSANLTDPRKPIGVFLMVGPSGVGKTETALALAELLYGGEQNITVINMSEFKEEHKVSMLLGSPPGYVGYGEGGVLTEAIRRRPYSVLLLDEMEKAHPGVQDIFYNLFDKGAIRDGEGRDIDFKNCVIIMTSNAGEHVIRKICAAQETLPEHSVLLDNFRPELLKYFKPAFLGRTNVIAYYPLGDENLMKICRLSMKRIEKRVREHYKADFSYDDDVVLHIIARCQEVDTGARNIENILNNTILPELASECLSRLANDERITGIHITANDDGQFGYRINSEQALVN